MQHIYMHILTSLQLPVDVQTAQLPSLAIIMRVYIFTSGIGLMFLGFMLENSL